MKNRQSPILLLQAIHFSFNNQTNNCKSPDTFWNKNILDGFLPWKRSAQRINNPIQTSQASGVAYGSIDYVSFGILGDQSSGMINGDAANLRRINHRGCSTRGLRDKGEERPCVYSFAPCGVPYTVSLEGIMRFSKNSVSVCNRFHNRACVWSMGDGGSHNNRQSTVKQTSKASRLE